MSGRLQGRNAIILGASQPGGSGWTVARILAEEGARVAVAARRLDKVQALAEEIGGLAFRCDAGEEAQVVAFVDGAAAQMGRLDIAVAAVGLGAQGSIDETGQAALDEAFRVNFFGPFHFTRFAARHMTEGGSITLFSSITSTDVLPGSVAYSCAKGALNSFTRYAAVEYAPRGIRVNALKAGVLEGPQARRWRRADMFDRLLKEVPLGAPVETEELGRMVVWLAADARSITGETIHVDGGGHLRRQIFPDEMSEAGLQSMGRRRTDV
ncbi:SDR family NAD(P)-dependent oxidoreductase [Flavisphingomonas formosensis]|uniref:SDR family NAD(P)-dependent oxidoreductase n=1 Tax=Flavisphingomonas formosensis TaxID=861534 RepID=UPI0012F745C8|nr:SDR family oxidoreductase [Sphingomonas formosensis]